jgi:uncharacterized sulfatase
MIVRWPGVVKAGHTINETSSHLDWAPTFCRIAGVDPNPLFRGRNLLPILEGRPVDWPGDLFSQYSMWDWHQNGAKLRSYRTPEWKLIRDYRHGGRDELYHLTADPDESVNLIRSEDRKAQKIKADLEKRLIECMREIDDPVMNP